MIDKEKQQALKKYENLWEKECIRTHTGIYVNVFKPTPEMFVIEDIAHSLSNQCRFSGHLPKFYSVAQHSCYVSGFCKPKNKLAGLLHDASEAYLLDLPRPIKAMMPQYKEIEDQLMKIISKKFCFNYPFNSDVKKQDIAVLEWEWSYLFLKRQNNKYKFNLLEPGLAKQRFLDLFEELKKTT